MIPTLKHGQRLRGESGWVRRVGAIVNLQRIDVILTVRGHTKPSPYALFDGVKCPLVYEDLVVNIAAYLLEFPELAHPSPVGKPDLGEATLVVGHDEHWCRITDVDRRNVRINLPSYIPRPGDAGAPIIQDDKVVAMLASYWLNDMLGMGPRIDVALQELLDYFRRTNSTTR